jgi:hypothetical protein
MKWKTKMENKRMENNAEFSFAGKQRNGKQKWKTKPTNHNTSLQVKL